MQAHALIEWPEPILELADFIGLFLSAGAIGFRYSALRGKLDDSRPDDAPQTVFESAARQAAAWGIVGALIALAMMIEGLPAGAARAKLPVSAFVTSNLLAGTGLGLAVLAVLGFALAMARPSVGWPLAFVGVILGRLRSVLFGRWSSLINPIHKVAAGLWIGTLFILVAVGLGLLFRREPSPERRGRIAADMVNAFSPLALVMGAVVALFGVITAWKHLNPLSSLWTTPYGWTLIAKLVVVAVVFGLGAFNWRRQRPTLGSDEAARGVRRSATGELVAAGIVLVITAFLVSLPSPRPPGAGGPPGGGPGGPPPAGAPPGQ